MSKNKKMTFTFLAVILLALASYLYQTVPDKAEIYTVAMKNNEGVQIGTIQLSETKAGVLLGLEVSGLTPDNEHAIHIHETGDCTPIETFKNAGGHYNPMGKSHGMKHPEGKHAGDMPNLKPNKKGESKAQILNTEITLGASTDKQATVFDEDGSAIVIHAGADDHMSQPSGAAGARIACGVISK